MIECLLMARYTIREVGEKLGVEKDVAQGVVKLLVEHAIIRQVGVRKMPSGPAPNVYEFSDGHEEKIADLFRRAQL